MKEHHQFLARLRSISGDNLIIEADRLRVYETDGLTAKRQTPMAVVLPETIDEIQQIVALCNECAVPVVARGAGTGLSGGAMPHEHGVLLGLAKLNRILAVDQDNRTATIQPGVTNLAISAAVAPLGLYYAPDPSSQIACTIGGNVAENSGGVHCLKYGLTVHNVRALRVVTATGELLEIGGEALDSPGYELLALMHGSEGLLGIVVEVTVNLLPKPEAVCVVLAAFERISNASDAVGAIIASGILPAGLEMMDQPAIQAAEAYVGAGYPTDAAAILLCELDGTIPEIEAQLKMLQAVLGSFAARDIRVAWDGIARAKLWQGRKAAFPAVGRIAPDYFCMDGTIPRRELASVLAGISDLARHFGLGVANVFHAGDGNLHPLILFDANSPGELERAEAFGSAILQLCIKKGGTITGEHGVGVEKINEMCIQFNERERTLFLDIKAAFDPGGILNPGKAIPTLHRCAEFGAMHVRSGKERFPGLDRF